MTLPQILFASISILLFLIIGMAVAAYRESQRKLKTIKNAHKAEQTTISEDELEAIPDLDPVWWEELGIMLGERPYVKVR